MFLKSKSGPCIVFFNAKMIRYPNDTYDRVWVPQTNQEWFTISTRLTVAMPVDDDDRKPNYDVPSVVMQTAVTPVNTTKNLIWFPWEAQPNHIYPLPGYV
jgi:hypothetical protein